jgi:gliding motility-associated-like protein
MKCFACLAAALLSCLLTAAQQPQFPYAVVIDTVVGDCFNNCQAVVTLRDAQGHLIPTDDSLHQPLDPMAYPISNLQYHYKNQLYNSVFYSNSHVLTMDVGTYDIGVSGYVMVQSETTQVPVQVDTTFHGITLSSTYNPFSASVLASIAGNDYVTYWGERRERCGNRHSLPCGDRGRVQMKLTSGKFPYTVIFTDAQEDTVRYVIFNQPQHTGTDSLYADYKDYYTFDSLPPGVYRIEAFDACSYTSIFHHTVELNDVQINYHQYKRNPNNNSDSNTVRFRTHFYCPKSVYNYDYAYFETIFEYRFIHSDGSGHSDTTSWRPIDGSSLYNSSNGVYCDTVSYASRYCDIYGDTIRFEMRDLCHQDTVSKSLIMTPPNTTCFVTDQWDTTICFGQSFPDTCHELCDSAVTLMMWYRIWYNCNHYSNYTSSNYDNLFYYTYPLKWIYTDSATGQVIKEDPVSEITSKSTLTHSDIENIYGPYSYLALPIVRTLVDAHGCELMSRFDTLLFYRDTTPAIRLYSWDIDSNYNHNNYSSCFYWERYITIFEKSSPFPLFRDSVVVRLITSPLYNKYNFTATYANGVWTIVKDDSVNNDANIVAQNMSVSIRSNWLSGGLYVFVCETACGIDTLWTDIKGIYYNSWEWIEDPEYLSWQECNDLLVLPVAGKYRQYTYHIDSQVSNDEPIVSFYDYSPSISLVSGEVGGYSSTSTSMNVPFRFTIPGDYIIRMSFSGCGDYYSQIDTIHFVRVRVDFEKAYAVMCDSTVNTGTAIARAIDGSEPYTYMLYSQPDLHGSLLGTSQDGNFYNIPMDLGQEMSILVVDSCENSFSINIVAMSMAQSQLLWFEGGTPNPGVCVGDTVTLSALPITSVITYSWTGPEGFTATGEQVNYCAADTSSKGWLVVDLLNTGCPTPIKDSLYLNVLTPPQVFVSAVDTVCAGDTVQVYFAATGTGVVSFDMGNSCAGVQSWQSLSVMSHDTLSLSFPIETENLYWVSQASDLYCPGDQHPDTVQVSIHPVFIVTDTTHISAEDILVCYGSDALLSAYSGMSSSCILNWYDNTLQTTVLQQDTLHAAGESSSYTIPNLLVDTTLYVAVWGQDNCPAHIGRADFWMNIQNGTTVIQPGQAVRLYDSGGGEHPYANNESLTHTFQTPNSGLVLVRFNSLEIAAGDTLSLYAGNGTLLGAYTGTQLPANLTLSTSSLSFHFASNSSDTSSGWSLDILTPLVLTEVSADVVHFFDTLATSVCQTDEPFDFFPFSQINITEPGIIQLDTMLYSVMGCDSSIALTINVLPVKSSSLDTAICEGNEYLLGDNHYSEEGTYLCHFTADNGCDSVVTLQLGIIAGSTEILSSAEDFCDYYQTVLSVLDGGDAYIWSTGAVSPTLEAVAPGRYSVTTYHQGCEVTASYVITPCQWELYLPNAITPGRSEGLNDVFSLTESQKAWITDFELYIYNRWGELVYTSQDKNFKWDGSVNGKIYMNNVYNYIIRLTDRNMRRRFYNGSITVVG